VDVDSYRPAPDHTSERQSARYDLSQWSHSRAADVQLWFRNHMHAETLLSDHRSTAILTLKRCRRRYRQSTVGCCWPWVGDRHAAARAVASHQWQHSPGGSGRSVVGRSVRAVFTWLLRHTTWIDTESTQLAALGSHRHEAHGSRAGAGHERLGETGHPRKASTGAAEYLAALAGLAGGVAALPRRWLGNRFRRQ